MLIVGNHYLLPDAKMFENIPNYHIVRNFPRNIA